MKRKSKFRWVGLTGSEVEFRLTFFKVVLTDSRQLEGVSSIDDIDKRLKLHINNPLLL